MSQDLNTVPTTIKLEHAITISLLTPLGRPESPSCRWGVPILIWGVPGIGKSERVAAACSSAALHMEEIYAAGHYPEDFGGTTMRVADGSRLTRVCALEEVISLVNEGSGVLFLDEISCAPPAVQAALLNVVLTRRIGGTVFPPRVRVLAAANPPSDAANGWSLSAPLANRFIHLAVSPPSVSEWSNWLDSEYTPLDVVNCTDGERIVTENWANEYARAKAVVAEFHSRFTEGEYLYKMPAQGDESRERAWPSPRTWAYATRIIATCEALAVSAEERLDMVTAAVGPGAAQAFCSFLINMDLPSPASMIANGWTPDTLRVDRSAVAYKALATYVAEQTDPARRIAYATKAWGMLNEASQAHLLDCVAPAAAVLVNHQLGTSHNAELSRACSTVLTLLGKSGASRYLEG